MNCSLLVMNDHKDLSGFSVSYVIGSMERIRRFLGKISHCYWGGAVIVPYNQPCITNALEVAFKLKTL